MNFSEAVSKLFNGERVCKTNWDKDEYLEKGEGFLLTHYKGNKKVPYSLENGDLSTNCWRIYK